MSRRAGKRDSGERELKEERRVGVSEVDYLLFSFPLPSLPSSVHHHRDERLGICITAADPSSLVSRLPALPTATTAASFNSYSSGKQIRPTRAREREREWFGGNCATTPQSHRFSAARDTRGSRYALLGGKGGGKHK